MSAKILVANGQVIRRNTFRHLTLEETESPDMIENKSRFTTHIWEKLGPPTDEEDLVTIAAVTPEYKPYVEDNEELSLDDEADYKPDTLDVHIASQVLLPKGEEFKLGTVRSRLKDINEYPIGRSNENPILDSRIYEVELPDGEVFEYMANTFAENLYSQVDEQGCQHTILCQITDHKFEAPVQEQPAQCTKR